MYSKPTFLEAPVYSNYIEPLLCQPKIVILGIELLFQIGLFHLQKYSSSPKPVQHTKVYGSQSTIPCSLEPKCIRALDSTLVKLADDCFLVTSDNIFLGCGSSAKIGSILKPNHHARFNWSWQFRTLQFLKCILLLLYFFSTY